MTVSMSLLHFETVLFAIVGACLLPSVSSFALPKKYDVVIPNHLHPTRHRRDLTTKTQTGHLADTSFSFTSNGKTFVLNVYLNSYLLHGKYFEAHQRFDGTFIENKGAEHCYYHGNISGIFNTSVVLSTCDGLRGSIRDANGKIYGIEPRENSTSEHIFYDIEDLPKRDAKCGVDGEHHDLHAHDVFNLHTVSRFRRAASSLEKEKRYITLVLVNDKRQYEKFKSNITTTVRRALEIANHVDELYKTINTRVAVVYIETWNIVDLIHVSASPSESLDAMGSYNKNVLVSKLWAKNKTRFDNAQLITGIDFTGNVVGMAGIGTICGLASTGVDQDFSSSAAVSAATVAHELGHNLGMPHDGGGCSCTVSHCVMSAVGGGAAQGFSSCSANAFTQRVKDGLGSCLFDVPPKLFGPPVCGNDFLEEGEQCDCGTVAECNATGAARCCNATTCTLQQDAECAIGPCCKDCKFISQGTVCRSRQTECDLEEACTGKSQECPGNFYRSDGTPCRNDTAYCFEGGCRTHVEQCGLLWGIGAKMGHNICYRENMEGSEWSNCGQNDLKQYTKCAEQDILCGTVQCSDTPNKWPILGTGHRARTLTHYITSNGVSKQIQCRQGITDLGPDLDNPTLTQQGTKCGDNKICISHKCVNLTSLDFIKTCANDSCHNGGICNNMGHCHCPVGFACPDCKHAGQGGSVDSGHKCYVPPTTLPGDKTKKGGQGMSTLAKSLLIIFVGIVPAVVIGLILAYKFRASLPCKSSTPQSSGYQHQTKPGLSKSQDQTFHKTPDDRYQARPGPTWLPNQQQSNIAYSNNHAVHGIENPQMHQAIQDEPVKPSTPGRRPPPPPSAPAAASVLPAKPLTPAKPRGNAPLPPVRPVNSPPGPPKPAKLPPMVPLKPVTK